MPKTVIKEIICPQCNAVTEGKLYTSHKQSSPKK